MLTSVAAPTAESVPMTPLAGQCEEQHKKKIKISCTLPALPNTTSSYCVSKNSRLEKNKMVRKIRRKKKKSSVRILKSKALFERSAIQVGNKVS